MDVVEAEWHNLPKEIKEKMLEYQVKQGNYANEAIFINSICAPSLGSGFKWLDTEEGHDFWRVILREGNINHFYTVYPKKDIVYELWS